MSTFTPDCTSRRIGVVLNYLSLVGIMAFFYVGGQLGWDNIRVFGMLMSAAVVIATFLIVHAKTGLWRLTHSKVASLDEREIYLTHDALRVSYSIFTVVILSIVLIFSLFNFSRQVFSPLLPAVLIYLAHTLPASVIAWKRLMV